MICASMYDTFWYTCVCGVSFIFDTHLEVFSVSFGHLPADLAKESHAAGVGRVLRCTC